MIDEERLKAIEEAEQTLPPDTIGFEAEGMEQLRDDVRWLIGSIRALMARVSVLEELWLSPEEAAAIMKQVDAPTSFLHVHGWEWPRSEITDRAWNRIQQRAEELPTHSTSTGG